ncbi:hypothetical protein HY095_05895 [Candidatus Micrarchaeota archaeon]|nr:hypothetical protein [Candidatus Micrarchaeota archaeon]
MAHKPRMEFDVGEIISGMANGNARYRDKVNAAAPGFFASRARGQTPHTAVVECADSWVSLPAITRTPMGRVFTIAKNAGNIVDPLDAGTVANAAYALGHLPSVNLIVVNGHRDCGGIKGLDALGTGKVEPEIERHLRRAFPALRFVDRQIRDGKLPAEGRHNAIVEANVLLGEEMLGRIRAVREAIGHGFVAVRGTVYDPHTGILHLGFPTLEEHGLVGEGREFMRKVSGANRA